MSKSSQQQEDYDDVAGKAGFRLVLKRDLKNQKHRFWCFAWGVEAVDARRKTFNRLKNRARVSTTTDR